MVRFDVSGNLADVQRRLRDLPSSLRDAGQGRGIQMPIVILAVWGLLVILCGFIAIEPKARLGLYFAGGVPWGLAEVIYVFRAHLEERHLSQDVVAFRESNLLLLGCTMGIWIVFNDAIVTTGCIRRQDFPGHALFHILASFSTILTFCSFASERRV
jgi:hypothetical protein